MLRELHISGLGVIDDLDLELDPGLNVLTGETGAGKTMVTVGLALALGQRGASSLVRPGARAARVQARFGGLLPASAGEWVEDGELVLARSIGADGKSSVRIGGQIATVAALAAIGPELIEVHGQHSGLGLLRPAAHVAFLDRFVGDDHLRELAAYRRAHARLTACRSRLGQLADVARDRERELDLLSYQAGEIEDAGVEPGELGDLRAEEDRLGNAERIAELAAAAAASLSVEGGGVDFLRAAASDLAHAASMDREAQGLSARMAALAEEGAELAREVREHAEAALPDPDRLEAVRARLRVLTDLRRKYGDDEAEILDFLATARTRLEALAGTRDERTGLEAEAEDLRRQLDELAQRVSTGRRRGAPELSTALEEELGQLGMEGASIRVALEPLEDPGANGAERVELRFSAVAVGDALPLARTGSGGELSRVMLACRSVLADLDEIPTLVFDEVDAGIGGRAGVAVGRRLARLAGSRQVLVVTHLPQIASFADRHIRVEKLEGTATVGVLEDADRVAELSRMLSGLPGSERAASHAEELLSEASKDKASAR